ncbi:hypothetical protein B0A50_03974 [Salinomyces thailandicus]|uniref:Nucleoporin Nup159/Nup146 N-terminal domain-containing protein n=1 Tax=Salinomyces thailandicus TaxID=706561 RepID=A0A4V5N672_9PEZI|nr:hypothetical protein B0A50_03974 [Salinomyces thailandica]
MSFGFGGGAAFGGGGSSSDLEDITTEQLGFQSASGEDKLRLLPSGWPADSQPPPSASLLSVASSKGLVAAAGPDTLVLAQTDKLRQTFGEGTSGAEKVKEFAPDATIAIPRVSQVAFSSDESCLAIAADQGGGLAVYETNALTSGGKDAAFQIGTQGVGVRQLLPNPNPSESTAHLFAIVLQTGQLLLADLKTRELAKSSGGTPVFHENVTCACWSRLGKQIMAGKQDGTAVQIDPQGNVKAEIPRLPDLAQLVDNRAQGCPLTSIYWIETNDFLIIHTPVYGPDVSDDMPPSDDSIYHLAQRPNPKSNEWSFRKVIEPTPPGFSATRKPAHHFIQRLKDWPPHLDDLLLLISTISTEVGMMTKSQTALDPEKQITGMFTTTLPEDVRRAGLPMSVDDAMVDTSPIGMAVDLSVKETIKKPIPNDETLDESPVPLPALYVLNNEGMLRIWYVVYNAGVRQKMPFPDLVVAGGPRQRKESTAVSTSATAPTLPSTASPSPFGAPASQPAQSGSAFGAPSTPGFGGVSALGGKPSPWATPSAGAAPSAGASAFGKPTFGSATSIGGGGGFGQAGGLGTNKPSVWGTSANAPSPGPKFGQASTLFGGNTGNSNAMSPFAAVNAKTEEQKPGSGLFGGSGTGTASLASPFSSFGNKDNNQSNDKKGQNGSPFGGLGTQNETKPVGFHFGKPSAPSSKEETTGGNGTPTGPTSGAGLFGSGGFKLGSTFKGDGTAKNDLPKPKDAGASFFGSGFGSSLGGEDKKVEPTTPIKKEPGTEDEPKMDDIPIQSSKPMGLDAVLNEKPKRFLGDLPPSDVPDSVPKEMPKRVFGDVPPSDGGPSGVSKEIPQRASDSAPESGLLGSKPKEEPKKTGLDFVLDQKPQRFFGDIPPSDIPGDVPPTTTKAMQNERPEVPVAGSPPVDLGGAKFSEEEEIPAGPEDDDDDDWDEQGETDGEEGEESDEGGETDEDDEDDEGDGYGDEEPEITDTKALSAFHSRLTPASPAVTSQQEESTTPATDKKPSYTPAGFPKGPVFAPPSKNTQESPRSPSPVRSFTAPQSKPAFQPPPSRSVADQPSGPAQGPAQPQRIAVPSAPTVERPASPARPREPTEGELRDEEDDRVQEILASDPQPEKNLPDFLAHQNYVGEAETLGVGGQIEKVYRDINSMLDTLGLNAHYLSGFAKGQNAFKNHSRRSQAELEEEESWTLEEGGQIGKLVTEIDERLEDGQLEDVKDTMNELREEEQEVNRSRVKMAEVRKVIRAHTDREKLTQQLTAPLPPETQAQQSELRQGVQRVQKLLDDVEEAMTLLRADLASAASASGQTNGAKMPTVEAVMNTILKMTAMIEQKSGDIDVLEAQIKRLPGGLASLKLNENYEDQLVSSLASSKLLNGSSPYTPSASRSRMLPNGDAPGMSGMLGSRFRTPPSKSGRRSVMFSPEASRLGMSTGSYSGSMRKKMVDVTEEEVKAYQSKAGRRRGVTEALRASVEGKGVRTVKLDA